MGKRRELDDGAKRELIELARGARCTIEEWGTEDQVERFNAFIEAAGDYMTWEQTERWEAYSMKAENNEIVDEALRILQIKDEYGEAKP